MHHFFCELCLPACKGLFVFNQNHVAKIALPLKNQIVYFCQMIS